jgi:hypothetical protein
MIVLDSYYRLLQRDCSSFVIVQRIFVVKKVGVEPLGHFYTNSVVRPPQATYHIPESSNLESANNM